MELIAIVAGVAYTAVMVLGWYNLDDDGPSVG